MSWNNGPDDVYGRLNNTKDVGQARFPFIEDGTHKLALAVLEEFQHSADGPSARAIFEVVASNKHQVGSYVVKIWKLVKPPFKPGMTTDADMFADFCRKLKGAPVGYPIGNDIRVLMKERPADQLARGTVIECVGVPKDYVKRDGSKATWVNVYWNNIPQTPQDIAASRQRLEAKGIPTTGASPAQQYGVEARNPQYAAAPSPAAPPQGGFLANLPPNNGNNGNQGGSW